MRGARDTEIKRDRQMMSTQRTRCDGGSAVRAKAGGGGGGGGGGRGGGGGGRGGGRRIWRRSCLNWVLKKEKQEFGRKKGGEGLG